MKNTPLCIYDKDTVYVSRLSHYLMGCTDSPFLIRTYYGDDLGFLEDIKEGFLLISSSMLRDEIKRLKAGRVIVLNEGDTSKEYEEFLYVDKYQSAARLYDFLLDHCASRDDILQGGNQEKHAVFECVYSPIGRIGKSMFCRNLCKEYSQKGRTLLLNFEDFSKEYHKGKGLSELIYFYKAGEKSIASEIEGVAVCENGYDRIMTAVFPSDLWDMSTAEMRDFLLQIIDCGLYDYVVLDLNHLGWLPDIFEIADTIYIPYIDSDMELERIRQLEALLEMFTESHIKDRVRRVRMIIPDQTGGI